MFKKKVVVPKPHLNINEIHKISSQNLKEPNQYALERYGADARKLINEINSNKHRLDKVNQALFNQKASKINDLISRKALLEINKKKAINSYAKERITKEIDTLDKEITKLKKRYQNKTLTEDQITRVLSLKEKQLYLASNYKIKINNLPMVNKLYQIESLIPYEQYGGGKYSFWYSVKHLFKDNPGISYAHLKLMHKLVLEIPEYPRTRDTFFHNLTNIYALNPKASLEEVTKYSKAFNKIILSARAKGIRNILSEEKDKFLHGGAGNFLPREDYFSSKINGIIATDFRYDPKTDTSIRIKENVNLDLIYAVAESIQKLPDYARSKGRKIDIKLNFLSQCIATLNSKPIVKPGEIRALLK